MTISKDEQRRLAKLGFTLLRSDDSKLESEGQHLVHFVLGPHHLESYLELLAMVRKAESDLLNSIND